MKDIRLVTFEDLQGLTAGAVAISATQPTDQAIGGLWFDISDGTSEVGESGIQVANAVVSESEPQGNPDLWFKI